MNEEDDYMSLLGKFFTRAVATLLTVGTVILLGGGVCFIAKWVFGWFS
jgi:hypothetical protein